MAQTTPPTLTPPGTAPDPNDRGTFDSRSYALTTWFSTLVTEMTAALTNVYNNAVDAFNNATAAASSAGSAASSASSANTAKDTAVAAAASAALLVEKYLGVSATDPTLDLTGGPLTAGDWYVNSGSGLIRAYTGTAWTNALNVTAGVASVNGQSGSLTGFVTETGSQTLSNKTLAGVILNDGYSEEQYSLTGTDISAANGSIQYKTLAGNTTFTESLTDGQSVTLMLNPSTFSVTWPTATWIGSSASAAPTLVASVYNCITFFQMNGTLYAKYEGRV